MQADSEKEIKKNKQKGKKITKSDFYVLILHVWKINNSY